MNHLGLWWSGGDAISHAVAALLMLMSIGAWVVIFWKGAVLRRAQRDLRIAVPRFWAAADLPTARESLAGVDREGVLLTLLDAALQRPSAGTLEAGGQEGSQLTRRLREALHAVLRRLRFGQVLLASVGSVAPFVGLFGTVWGIYHALVRIASEGNITIDKVAGPVGEALIMTAAGLAVAIPAVLAYNIFNKAVSTCEADLEGYAHDLREMLLDVQRSGG